MQRGDNQANTGQSRGAKIAGIALLAVGGVFVFGAIALGQSGPSKSHLRVAVDPSGTGSVQGATAQSPYAVVGGPKITTKHRPVFTFASNVTGATFRCQLDGGQSFPCSSPFHVPKRLRSGKHKLVVQAVDPKGVTSPAVIYRFKVVNHPVAKH